MQIKLQTVTPEIAASWLKMNTSNRPLNERRAAALAKAILRGEWMVNGDTIRMSNDGVLLDGQHRLSAIVKSGVAVETFVAFGIPSETFTTIDTGRPRTAGDALALRGVKHYNGAAAAARAYLMWKKHGNPVTAASDRVPTTAEIDAVVTSNHHIVDGQSFIAGMKWIVEYMGRAIAGFLYVVGQERNPGRTVEFFTQISSPVGPRDAVVDLLRDRLMINKASKQKLSKFELYALCTKAFRSFLRGEDVRQLKVATKGKKEKDIFSL